MGKFQVSEVSLLQSLKWYIINNIFSYIGRNTILFKFFLMVYFQILRRVERKKMLQRTTIHIDISHKNIFLLVACVIYISFVHIVTQKIVKLKSTSPLYYIYMFSL